MMVCRVNIDQVQPVELQKSLLEQMNNRLRETEEHIRQEIANKVSIRVSLSIERTNISNFIDQYYRNKEFWRRMLMKWNNGRRGKLSDLKYVTIIAYDDGW